MPFTKVGKNTYRSPSGIKFTKKQVIAYYATNGFKKKLPTKKELIGEHKHLIPILRKGSKKTRTKEANKQAKELKGYEKMKVSVNNKLKGALGASEGKGKGKNWKPTGKIQVNVKAHKGDKKELASTIKHEMMHIKHPKMTEKQVYKKTAKSKISPNEQSHLLSKLKGVNYKVGAVKRKLKLKGDTKPGDLISKFNSNKEVSKTKLGIMGLI